MRPKLLKSFIVVCLFWFAITTITWLLAEPGVNLKSLRDLAGLLPFLGLWVPESASILNSWQIQLTVLGYWTVPILIGTLFIACLGLGFIWSWAIFQNKERSSREKGTGYFRGLVITRGVLPQPKLWTLDDLELKGTSTLLTKEELNVLADIMGIISSNAAVIQKNQGVVIEQDLIEYTMHLVRDALALKKQPGLAALVVAGNVLGFLARPEIPFRAKEKMMRFHDKTAVSAVTALPSWWALPEGTRNALMLCLRFYHRPREIPDLAGDSTTYSVARAALDVAYLVVNKVVEEEKQKTLESTESLSDVIFKVFIDCLPMLAFQSRSLARGVPAVAFKVSDSRVYLLDTRMRETLLKNISDTKLRQALTPNENENNRLQPITLALLQTLDEKGWLVKEHEGITLEQDEALWNITSGNLEFKGAIGIDVPEEFQKLLPTRNSMYPIEISGTLFTPRKAANPQTASTIKGTPVSREDLPLRASTRPKLEEKNVTLDKAPLSLESKQPSNEATVPGAPSNTLESKADNRPAVATPKEPASGSSSKFNMSDFI